MGLVAVAVTAKGWGGRNQGLPSRFSFGVLITARPGISQKPVASNWPRHITFDWVLPMIVVSLGAARGFLAQHHPHLKDANLSFLPSQVTCLMLLPLIGSYVVCVGLHAAAVKRFVAQGEPGKVSPATKQARKLA